MIVTEADISGRQIPSINAHNELKLSDPSLLSEDDMDEQINLRIEFLHGEDHKSQVRTLVKNAIKADFDYEITISSMALKFNEQIIKLESEIKSLIQTNITVYKGRPPGNLTDFAPGAPRSKIPEYVPKHITLDI